MNELRGSGRLAEADPIAHDGDDLRCCSTCGFGSVRLPAGIDKRASRVA